jgi:hypothetical protein
MPRRYRLVNFIHDEILVELPEGSNLALHAEIVRNIMIESMQQVVPDVNVDVQYSVSEMWAKSAEMVVDEVGRLAVWKGPVVQDGIQLIEPSSMAMSA